MSTTVSDARIDLGRLFQLNRSLPTAETVREIESLERAWIEPYAAGVLARAPRFESRNQLQEALEEQLREEERTLPETHEFLAHHASLEQLKVVVAQFAVDGLIESHSLLPIVPRLPHRSGMAVFRVLIDEFGCGNVNQAHNQLYRDLLTELGMSTDLDDYLDGTLPEIYAYVDLFHWLASRAPDPEYFLGAYAYFESSVLYAFRSLAAAARRLGLRHAQYYTEHLYIDGFHSKQMQQAIRDFDVEQGADLAKVWTGIQLTSEISGTALDAAIEFSRQEVRQ